MIGAIHPPIGPRIEIQHLEFRCESVDLRQRASRRHIRQIAQAEKCVPALREKRPCEIRAVGRTPQRGRGAERGQLAAIVQIVVIGDSPAKIERPRGLHIDADLAGQQPFVEIVGFVARIVAGKIQIGELQRKDAQRAEPSEASAGMRVQLTGKAVEADFIVPNQIAGEEGFGTRPAVKVVVEPGW